MLLTLTEDDVVLNTKYTSFVIFILWYEYTIIFHQMLCQFFPMVLNMVATIFTTIHDKKFQYCDTTWCYSQK